MKEKTEQIILKDWDSITPSEKGILKKVVRDKYCPPSTKLTEDMVYAGYCMLKRNLLIRRNQFEMLCVSPKVITENYGDFGGGVRMKIQNITKKTTNGVYSDECGHITIGPTQVYLPLIDVSYKTEKLTIVTLMDIRNGQFFKLSSAEANFEI